MLSQAGTNRLQTTENGTAKAANFHRSKWMQHDKNEAQRSFDLPVQRYENSMRNKNVLPIIFTAKQIFFMLATR